MNSVGSDSGPSIELEGLKLWVHGRQYPNPKGAEPPDWLRAAVVCQAKGATVQADHVMLTTGGLHHFADRLGVLWNGDKAPAILRSLELDPILEVVVQATDALGHVTMTVKVSMGDHRHDFAFPFDQSYLPPVIDQCRVLNEKFPVMQPERRWSGA